MALSDSGLHSKYIELIVFFVSAVPSLGSDPSQPTCSAAGRPSAGISGRNALLQRSSMMGRIEWLKEQGLPSAANVGTSKQRFSNLTSSGMASEISHGHTFTGTASDIMQARPNVILTSGIQTYLAFDPPEKKSLHMEQFGVARNHLKPCKTSFSGIGSSPKECSPECPFWQYDPTKSCHFFCVAPADCHNFGDPLQNFANKTAMTCTRCEVLGCEKCGATEHDCKMCLSGYDLIEGQCFPTWRVVWWTVYGVLIFLILIVLIYVVTLWARPNENNVILREAIEYRHRSKERNQGDNDALWPLKTNVCSTFISGAGVILHFRWQVAVIAWCFLTLLMTLALSFLPHGQGAAAALEAPIHSTYDGQLKCMNSNTAVAGAEEHDLSAFDHQYIWFLLGIYVITTLGALTFACFQRSFFIHADDRFVCMEKYALYAGGFPLDDGQALVEEEYMDFMRKALPNVSIAGVSVCWDFRNQEVDLGNVAARDTAEREEREFLRSAASGLRPLTTEKKRGCIGRCLEKNWAGKHPLKLIDFFFLGNCGDREDTQRPSEKDITATLKSIKTSGHAFFVFDTEQGREEAFHLFHGKGASNTGPRFRGEHTIRMKRQHCDPETILWSGFGTTHSEFFHGILLGICAMCGVVLVWAALFYGPYVWYLRTFQAVPGMADGDWLQGTLMGLLIAIGNVVVYNLAYMIAGKAGFHFKDRRDKFYVILYTVAVFINTCLDMYTLWMLAYVKFDRKRGASTGDINSSIQLRYHLFKELMGYLYPGTLLFPFLLEPLGTTILPYYLSKWLIRSRPDAFHMARAAEECLACPEYDLSRYGDVLINVMLCILMLALASVGVWRTFAYLLMSLVFIYLWDQYRYLRQTTRCFFADESQDRTAHDLTSFACAMLAGCVALRLHGVGYIQWHSKSQLVLGAVIVHLALHLLFLRLGIPALDGLMEKAYHPPKTRAENFTEAATHNPCSWFTANPVHCLRSRYIYQHNPPCIYCVKGKEQLIERNPSIGVFFKASKDKPSELLAAPTVWTRFS